MTSPSTPPDDGARWHVRLRELATGNRGPEQGEWLIPLRRREVLYRSLYTAEHTGPDGGTSTYTVEFDGTKDWAAKLYRDGRFQAKADLPATFRVSGGRIEANSSLYGVNRMHLVSDSGEERRFDPAPGTLEDLRGRLARRKPWLSRTIAATAILVLVVNLVLAVPQVLEILMRVPLLAENFGTFTSPIQLPGWLNTVLLLAGVCAAVERVLTRRRNRLLDVETLWSGV
ncbi:hypothetical protein CFN78_23030 [Amycolatopsis antarctica]|uniref:Uncharacterized protein n=1 Tax=Amycolatopsis antarctica TaxID=1854586 RepID=A0A263CXT3_9PSEU|nr:hypothetical protein [Amycolatopsis antarctica]OZM70799.1 hypothetical protein CFN78_23030 [Amycolatopsis antarctica]